MDICLNFNLTQLVSEPTHVAGGCANILGLLLTNHRDCLSSILYLPELIDQKVIHGDFFFFLQQRDKLNKTITLYDKGNYDALNKELRNFFQFFESDFHSRSVRDNWAIFKHKINQLPSNFIPEVSLPALPQKLWFTNKLKKLANRKNVFSGVAKAKETPDAWAKYNMADKKYTTAICVPKYRFLNR